MVHLTRCLVIALLLLPAMVYASVPETGNAGDTAAAPQETGDAGATNKGTARRAVLEQRVTAKWEALIRRDFAAAYAFTSPAYREAFSLDAFKRNFGNGRVAWQRIEVVSVDFESDDAATVGIKIYIVYHDLQSQKSLDMATHDQEFWVYADGQWWYLVKR
jgi:hypothetical protein